jgi:serine/threonine protein kinase/tetratricopeptide (TPR) repeat protein
VADVTGIDTGEGKDGVVKLGDVQLQPGTRIGAYIYRRPVAEGGMAHVLMATDPGDREVALKLLKSGRVGSGLARFRREFRSLARLDHPNVVSVESYGDYFGHPYIAMEYVEGRDLHQEIRSYRNLPFEKRWERVEQVVRQIARALAYIHRRGLVHRDLKPSNILVGQDGTAKLTDFGIVKDLDPANDPFVSTTLVGTWAYASPEQISGKTLDHRSDLYSFGVILYAMLTGRRPFAARDMAGYLDQHSHRAPLAPSQIYEAIPSHLDEICLKLLEKAPRDRYQSGAEVLEQLDGAVVDALPTEEAPWEPPLVGLQLERDRVRDAVSALTRAQGGVCLVEGPEGTGRSRLLGEAVAHAKAIGIHTIVDRSSPGESTPEALLRVGRLLVAELGSEVPRELDRAISSFSAGQARQPGGQIGSDLRYQLYDGIRTALEGLLREEPVLICTDDLDHAPTPQVALLSYLVRTLVVRDGLPFLVIAALRNDSPATGLHHFRDGTELGLKPIKIQTRNLRKEELVQVVSSVVDDDKKIQSLSDRLLAETSGNPFFVAEFLRAMMTRGTIALDGELIDDDATEIAGGALVIPPGIRQVVQARLTQLSDRSRQVVEVAAVAGRELDLEILLDVLEVDEDEEESILDSMDELERESIIVQRRAGLQSLVEIANPKMGEVIYRDLPAISRVSIHRGIGQAMEAWHGGNPVAAEVIGEHFRRAGDAHKAYQHLSIAAGGMWGRNLLAEAWRISELTESLEELAQERLPEDEFQTYRLSLLRVRSDVFFNRGAWDQAREALTALRGLAMVLGDEALIAHAGLQLGATLRRLGQVDDGVSLVEAVLEHARRRRDRSVLTQALGRLASFAWEDGDWNACERLANQGLVSASKESRAPLLVSLAAVQASRGELALATSGLVEAEGIIRSQLEKRSQSIVLGNLAELLGMQGHFKDALQRCEEGLSLASDVLFREGEAFLKRIRASILLEVGDVGGAESGLRESLAISEEVGSVDDEVAARYLLGRHALLTGRAERARTQLEAGLESAQILDPEAYSPALQASLARAFCLIGRLEAAEQLLVSLENQLSQLAVPRRTQVQIHMAAVWLSMGQKDDALTLLRSAWRVCSIRGFQVWGLRCLMLMAEAVPLEQAAQVRSEAKQLAEELMSRLPAQLAGYFKRQPGLTRLWAAKGS